MEKSICVWRKASVALMSDKEDAILEDKFVWVTCLPTRCGEWSALCAVARETGG